MNDSIALSLIRTIERLIEAQRRIADADERRNELLEADRIERREAWEAHEAQQAEAIERIAGPREDPWRNDRLT